MDDRKAIAPAPEPGLSDAGSSSAATRLDPALQDAYARRLAGIALCYAAVYLTVEIYFWGLHFLADHQRRPADQELFVSTSAIALGLLVAWTSARRKLPPISFRRLALGFELAGGFGIMAGAWGWETYFDDRLRQAWSAVEPERSAEYLSAFIDPLVAEGVRLVEFNGTGWVATWILMYPLIVPTSPRATAVAALGTASTVPVVLGLSLAVRGVPDSLAAWWPGLLAQAAIPTYICAGIAIFGAHFLHRLTRDLARARRLGSYELVERIGAGGMGEVWRAEHRMLVRPAAIKLIRPSSLGAGSDASAATVRKRFEREAQATAELTSAHTIEIYDFGVTQEGTLYYVMELLRGIDLKTLVERHGPVPPERAVHLMRQACHSLADAELAGLVHRDVKPSNLFTCRKGRDHDFVKVLDFGLVKSVGRSGAAAGQLTEAGMVSGTPGFMAPEMAFGEAPVDGRSDLYALGCVGYWLLTGQLVFEQEAPMKLLLDHLQTPPVPPSERTELAIPASLDRVVLWCLEKRPEDRPGSAIDLGRALEDLGRDLPAWSDERALRWWRTHLPHVALPSTPAPTRSPTGDPAGGGGAGSTAPPDARRG